MKLDFDHWVATYKPRANHLNPHASSFDDGNGGIMFETYGAELDYVLECSKDSKASVWTYVDGDGGTYIIEGFRIANRIGYFVCDVPYEKGVQYEVEVSSDEAAD